MERTNPDLYTDLALEKKKQCTSKHRSQKRGRGCASLMQVNSGFYQLETLPQEVPPLFH